MIFLSPAPDIPAPHHGVTEQRQTSIVYLGDMGKVPLRVLGLGEGCGIWVGFRSYMKIKANFRVSITSLVLLF